MAGVKRAGRDGGLVACCFLFWAALPVLAASSSGTVLHPAAVQPINELSAFRVPPGFRVQLVASEPMVTSPVAMAFDEQGRLFVVETKTTPPDGGGAVFGRVRLLERPDTNGVFQASTIYAQDLPRPTAIACYAGGIFVGLPSEIRYFKDTHGDGNADLDKLVLSGFGGTNAAGATAALNSFTWGLQNRFYGNTAGLHGRVSGPTWQGAPLVLAGTDFSFDPRTLIVLPEAGAAQSGLSFDDWGNMFVSDYTRPLRLAMYEPRYTARNPFFPRLPALVDVASPATPVFQLVPAVSEVVGRGPSTNRAATLTRQVTNEMAASWLTNASGCVVYRGHAFPTNYLGNVFVAARDAHAVHRMVLRPNTLGMTAERPADERNTEFLAASDPGFHPVQVLEGPGGALYIADVRDGNEQGRIYRVVPANFRQPILPAMDKTSARDLVALLAQPDGWLRDTASRLLFERRDPEVVPMLTNMLAHSRLSLVRMQALHALAGVGGLNEAGVLKALRDTDARVREHGVLVAEALISDGNVSDALWAQLKALAADSSFRVRYQLAFTLGTIRRPDRPLVMGRILAQNPGSLWMQNAVLSSAAEGAGELYRALAGDNSFRSTPAGMNFLDQLGLMIGVKGRLDEVAQAIGFIVRVGQVDRFLADRLLCPLGDGLHRTRSAFALVDPQSTLQPLYSQAFVDVQDSTLPEAARVAAVRVLGISTYKFSDVSDWLLILCSPHPLTALRTEAITTLGRYEDPAVLPDFLTFWPGLPPALRQHTVSVLLSRSSRVGGVLQAIQDGRISGRDLAPAHLDFLRTYHDPNIRERALQLFGPVLLRRPQAEQQFVPALRLRGAADRGRALFQARCAQCHAGGPGQGLGPSLAGARTLGKAGILSAILEPNANIDPEQATAVVETKDGENLLGILEDDNPASITLREAGDIRAVWPRLNLQSVEIQRWSLMPSGLEQGLSAQGMADLIEYVMTAPELEASLAGGSGR